MEDLSLAAWVDNRSKKGLYCFTKKEILNALSNVKKNTIKMALHRLICSRRIISPWHNFYMAVPEEYALKGVVPQNLYIDQLMHFLGKDYYVCLMNAASLHGAAHQAVMTYSVMTSVPSLRSTTNGDMQTNFYSRKNVPMKFVVQRKTKTGYYNVSSPELTALDLISRYKEVGGLNRVAVIMNELVEAMDMSKMSEELLSFFSIADVQKLGYILDTVLDEHNLADKLYDLAHARFRKTALKRSKQADSAEMDKKWKILINENIIVEE
ncbi:MAG: type IV toxin-antitoxin system AbiEi family antitoxin [Muribaculaceae bacterium]|jgi:predicted transcriptional regulator of viral defense system|nr:type IV toxin-antitoxin system AbiEi family antitoxin [Muribaculaceae bacterium]